MWHGGVPTKLVVEGDPTVLVVDSIPTDLVVEGVPTRLVGSDYNSQSCLQSIYFLILDTFLTTIWTIYLELKDLTNICVQYKFGDRSKIHQLKCV